MYKVRFYCIDGAHYVYLEQAVIDDNVTCPTHPTSAIKDFAVLKKIDGRAYPNKDTKLDEGGANEISAADLKDANDKKHDASLCDGYTKSHDQNTDEYLSTQVTKILYVDKNRTDSYTENGSITKPYKNISSAITASSNGDVIKISPGTYQEDLIVNKGIVLIGDSKTKTTILRNTATETVIQIASSDVKIKNLTIDGGATTGTPSAPYSVDNLINIKNDATYNRLEVTNCHLLHCSKTAILCYSRNGIDPMVYPDYIATGYVITDNEIDHFAVDNGRAGIGTKRCMGFIISRNYIHDANPEPVYGTTYGGTGIYPTWYASGYIEDNIFCRINGAITMHSNAESVYIRGNKVTECPYGIMWCQALDKIYCTNNFISIQPDPTDIWNQYGIFAGGDGDASDICPPFGHEVDNLYHEVINNTIIATGHARSVGIAVKPGFIDTDFGASGHFFGNNMSNINRPFKVDGNGASGGDRTAYINILYRANIVRNYTTGFEVVNWTGANESIDAKCNWWGSSAPANISVKVAYEPFDDKSNIAEKIKVYSQTIEPTLDTDSKVGIWIDTDDVNRVYLVFRRGSGDQVKIELI